MIKHQFNPHLPHRAVEYGRMSTESQNKRSPDQQSREIRITIKRTGYNFDVFKSYRDEGISGRLLRDRIGYQQMMKDIKTGAIQTDLILVDTIERFGRVDELDSIRRDLYENYGVLVLAADTNFCDPLSPQGRAMAMFENMRATEDGRIKAHTVLRGKRDAVLHKHWPGGPPPFGYGLKSIMKVVNGREEVDHCILKIEETQAVVVRMLFAKAKQSGWGLNRLAGWLNNHADVPEGTKSFSPTSVGYILDNEIYYGDYVWNVHCTGIIADVRVLQKNPEQEWEHIEGFCEPIVSKELWMEVQSLREVRRARWARSHEVSASEKQIQAPAAGMTLNYLLSGLVYCAECGIRMTLSSTQAYVTKSGDSKNYASYACPNVRSGSCSNSIRVPEQWLREQVVNVLRERLFPWRSS